MMQLIHVELGGSQALIGFIAGTRKYIIEELH
jgi:hypothetical protein